jgi:hypothetical protein
MRGWMSRKKQIILKIVFLLVSETTLLKSITLPVPLKKIRAGKKLLLILPISLIFAARKRKYAFSDISHKAQQVSRNFGTASRE